MPVQADHPNLSAPRAGDLLLLDLACPACDAIAEVTKAQFGVEGPALAHVGLVVRHQGKEAVIEAWPGSETEGGEVQRVSIATFLSRTKSPWGTPRGPYGLRFGGALATIARRAATVALRHLGRPYDDRFLRENKGLYCAELLYEAFREANAGREFFRLTPMTFGKPRSPHREVWERYYRQRGAAVPEGKPGISPLGIYLAARRMGARPVRYAPTERDAR